MSAFFLLFISITALGGYQCNESLESSVVEINEENWSDLFSSNEWMVEFYAPWCPACQRFEAIWKKFSLKSPELSIRVGSADVNANPILSVLFSVTSLPTVYHIKDGQYRVYNGNRDINNLIDFIQNKEWQSIEPTRSWLTPNSFIIQSIGFFFKITLYFKDIYTSLTEKQGYSMWLVISMFASVTIIFGLLMGVGLIILIDCICPPKRYDNDNQYKEFNESDLHDDKVDESNRDDDSDTPVQNKEDTTVKKRKNKKARVD